MTKQEIAATQERLRLLAEAHADSPAVTGRTNSLCKQLDMLHRVTTDTSYPEHAGYIPIMRKLIRETSDELAQVVHDGGKYIPANHASASPERKQRRAAP